MEHWNTRPIEDALNQRIAELEAEVDQLTAHSDIERQDDKSPNDTQTQTIVYGKESDVIFVQSSCDGDGFDVVVCGTAAAYIYRDEDSEEVRFQAENTYNSYLTADDLIEIANKMKEMESGE